MNISASGIRKSDLNTQELFKGLIDAMDGKDPAVSPELIRQAMTELTQKLTARQQELAAKKLEENKAFLEANKKKDGVQVTDSGLQYQVLKAGSGDSPTAASNVSVHYEGKLINGQIFDSSYKRGQPASFGVTQVIKGWTEALLRMKVGDKWRLVIPSELGYGAQGSPGGIGPNEVLIFEVELLGIN